MTLRENLKRNKTVRGRRWIVKKDKNNLVSEVKMIFEPQEYILSKNPKPMYGDKDLLKILEKEYEKKKNNS